MLLSTSLVGSVIGRGGRTIRQITTKTGAKIGLKQDIIAFSQFSLPGKGRKTFKPAADPASSESSNNDITTTDTVISNKAGEEEEGSDEKYQSPDNKDTSTTPSTTDNNPEDDDGQPTESTANPVSESESTAAAAPPPPPPPPMNTLQSKLEIQSDQSQLAVLYGSREQCSAALYEILTICFRESKHRGFSDPCLGLLVEQQIYSHTPVQISSTSSSTSSSSTDGNDAEKKSNTTGNTDRVLVVRGHLNAICAAEAFLSEQIRWATIESVIPSHFWPLLNHLPPVPQVNNHKSSNNNNTPFSYDPQSVCSLIMSLGSIFWPQSVCAKLGKNSSLQCYNNNNKRSEVRNTNLSTNSNSGLPENDTTNTGNTVSPVNIHDDEEEEEDVDDADGDDADVVGEENHEEDLEYDAKTLVNEEDNLSEMNSEEVIQEGIDDNPINDKDNVDDDDDNTNNTNLHLDNTDLSSEDINEITVISVSASDMEDKDEVMTVIEVTDNDKSKQCILYCQISL
ncbi:unnamed protein product [Trichobilharzia regenti]|nr:unnamed protein product [Trichobilharzia regenti]